MWVGAHLLAGAAVYRLVEKRSLPVRIGLTAAGGFISHWALDEISSYHGLAGPAWYLVLVGFLNALAIMTVVRLGKWYALAALYAWLIFDFEWICGGSWMHNATGQGWLPRYLQDTSDLASIWIQVAIMGFLTLAMR